MLEGVESRIVSGHELKEDGVPYYEVEEHGRVDANGNFGHIWKCI